MYLTRLIFHQPSPVVVRALSDLHAMHRLLLQAFPDTRVEEGSADTAATERILYRIEQPLHARGVPWALIQSIQKPEWGRVASGQTNVLPLNRLLHIDGPKVWEPQFVTGATLRFRLRATPTVKREYGTDSAHPGHRRVGLFQEEEQQEWLIRKAASSGFSLREVKITLLGKLSGRSPRNGILTHFGVDYDGLLTVRDTELFHRALRAGIGAAKGFGFGLLSVARA